MARHPDFDKIMQEFVNQYGANGYNIYNAYIYNENLNEEMSMVSQFPNAEFNSNNRNIEEPTTGCSCGACLGESNEPMTGEFNIRNASDYPNILKNVGCVDNQDSITISFVSDEIENKYFEISKSMDGLFKTEKDRYKLIIEKYTQDNYDVGIREAANELAMEIAEFGDLRGKNKQIKILQDNSISLAFNLLDDINKEITLLMTDASLNNIPFTNQEIKKEITQIFSKKQGRLDNQVITESTRSFNTALEFGYKKSGLVAKKQWVAVIDNKTTSICRALNGEIVDLGEPFSTGDYGAPAHFRCRSKIQAITISEVNKE